MGLTTLRKRLERLEEMQPDRTDDYGLVPFSREWFEYWADQSRESPTMARIPGARMTLAQFRAVAAISRGECDIPVQSPG
jgi:hypothetical protein